MARGINSRNLGLNRIQYLFANEWKFVRGLRVNIMKGSYHNRRFSRPYIPFIRGFIANRIYFDGGVKIPPVEIGVVSSRETFIPGASEKQLPVEYDRSLYPRFYTKRFNVII